MSEKGYKFESDFTQCWKEFVASHDVYENIHYYIDESMKGEIDTLVLFGNINLCFQVKNRNNVSKSLIYAYNQHFRFEKFMIYCENRGYNTKDYLYYDKGRKKKFNRKLGKETCYVSVIRYRETFYDYNNRYEFNLCDDIKKYLKSDLKEEINRNYFYLSSVDFAILYMFVKLTVVDDSGLYFFNFIKELTYAHDGKHKVTAGFNEHRVYMVTSYIVPDNRFDDPFLINPHSRLYFWQQIEKKKSKCSQK
jgi:hypothetical protein